MAFPRFVLDLEGLEDQIDYEDVAKMVQGYVHGVLTEIIGQPNTVVSCEGHEHTSDDDYACRACGRLSRDGKN